MNRTFKLSALALAAALSLGACKQEINTENKAASAAASTAEQAQPKASTTDLGTPAQQASYAIGMDIGHTLKQLKDQGAEIDMKLFSQAVEDSLSGQTKLNDQQAQQILMTFLHEQQQKAQEKQEAQGKSNLEKGEAFLQENAKKEGVKTTASGLQYKINKEGTGKQPKADDMVSVEYEGRLIDGTVFDSSKAHGNQPVTFPLNQVIPGWTEGLQLMKEGGDYTFFVPAKLAYGSQAMGDKIGPNSTLIFDVKLVKVGSAPKAE